MNEKKIERGDAVYLLLLSGIIKKINRRFIHKLQAMFDGEKILSLLNEKNDIEIKNSFQTQWHLSINFLLNAWGENIHTWNFFISLYQLGLSSWGIKKIFIFYGFNAKTILTKNPYLLIGNLRVGFKTADAIAKEIGILRTDIRRIRAILGYIIHEERQRGNSCIHEEEYLKKACSLGEFLIEEKTIFIDILQMLFEEKKIVIFSKNSQKYYLLFHDYTCESEIAKKLQIICKKKFVSENDQKLIHQWCFKNNLTEEQKRWISSILLSSISFITGAAGTGKTTLIGLIMQYSSDLGKTITLLSPTGKAADRLAETTGCQAQTIHRAIGFLRILRAQRESILVEPLIRSSIIVVDESSMIDLFSWYSLIQSVHQNSTLVFVGDPYQLPAVGVGNILSDILKSNILCNRITLTTIFRQRSNQQKPSPIIVGSHAILEGNSKKFFDEAKDANSLIFINKEKEYFFIFLENLLDQYSTVEIREKIQIITMLQRGIVGVEKINLWMQQYMAKRDNAQKIAKTIFYIGDKVIQIKNDYKKEVFNGEIGNIIEGDDEKIMIKFRNKVLSYSKKEIVNLQLAYAITVHKSQGSEFFTVIIPLYMEQYLLLSRNLLYTAVTRTKTRCIVIGEKKAMYCALSKKKNEERNTVLRELLDSMSGEKI